MPFNSQLSPLSELAQFYGTDGASHRDTYSSSISRAINSRVMEPVKDCCEQRRDYFFKPYSSISDGVLGLFHGPVRSALIVARALGMLGVFSSPYFIIAQICLPAVIELLAGLVSLSQALYHAGKSVLNRSEKELDKSKEYLLDATTRFSLVIPLVLVCSVALPFELARFFTRSAATVEKFMSERNHSLSVSGNNPPIMFSKC